MPKFFFDVVNRIGLAEDSEGAELADREAARSHALDSIRSIIAEEARSGIIDLRGRVEVRAESGDVFSVRFEEAEEVLTGDPPAPVRESEPRR